MSLTANQRRVATAFSRQAYMLGTERVQEGAEKKYDEGRYGQVLAVANARQVDLGHAIVACYRTERFGSVLVLTRAILEGAAELCWAALPKVNRDPGNGLLRILAGTWRDAQQKGYVLPPDAAPLLALASRRGLKKVPSFDNQLTQLDKHERSQQGGIEHWKSHGDHYEYASKHVHPSGHGPLFTDEQTLSLLGFEGLKYSHQYFSLGGQALCQLAGLRDVELRLLKRYAAIKPIQEQELDRLLK